MPHTIHRPAPERPATTELVRCRTCSTPMTTDRLEGDERATARWYSCPVCHHRRMTCAPDAPAPADRRDRDDDAMAA